jgi:hypothetical protein
LSAWNAPHWQRHTQTESERMETIYQGSGSQKQTGVVILLFDNVDFKQI